MEQKGTKTLETQRLILRRFKVEDAPAMFQNWASDDEVTKYLTWPAHKNVQETENTLKIWCENYNQPDYYQWAIVLKDGTDEPIGSIGVNNRIDDKIRMAHIGYCIGTKWWHQGITSEALQVIVDFLFDEVGVNRVESRHDPRNPYSGAVMRKCGLRYEGTLRQSDWNNQGICDAAYYAILACDRKKARHQDQTRFLPAEPKEKEEILQLYHSQVGSACCPWDEFYPAMEEIEADMSRGDLFILKNERSEILAAISIDREEEIEALSCWSKDLQPSVGLSRLAVAKRIQNQGIARQMLQYAMEILRNRGCKSVHFLVNRENEKAIRSYAHMDFRMVGECRLFEQDFLCYEKEL